MKTRILHTRFWQDSYVVGLTYKEKLTFLYLLTNDRVGLTGIYELPDRYIQMDVGLTRPELQKIKTNFQKSGKFFFSDGWVVILNVNRYNNYVSNEKVKKAYNRELENVPEKLKEFALEIESEEYVQDYVRQGGSYKHIVIAEKYLGRQLRENEVVHHIDKNPSNNECSNLAIMDRQEHISLHNGKIEPKDTSMILVSDYYDTLNNHKSKIINHNIEDITEKDFQEIAERYQVPIPFVRSKYDDMVLWAGERTNNPKTKGRNWKLTLMSWVKKDSIKIKLDSKRKGGFVDATKV